MTDISNGRLNFPLGSKGVSGAVSGFPRTSKATIDPHELQLPIGSVRGVGRTTEKRLRNLGIETVEDLLLHLPFRHESPSRICDIASLTVGEEVILRARVISVSTSQTAKRRVGVLQALVSDDSGSVVATWYNQNYLEAAFQDRPDILLKGNLVRQRGTSCFMVKRHEILDDTGESLHILGLVPVYPSTADLSVRTLRNVINECAPLARNFIDPLPARLLARHGYMRQPEAILLYHFPASQREASRARQRLAFEELLLLQLAIRKRRLQEDRDKQARPLNGGSKLATTYLETFPYEATGAQKRVISEIERDLNRAVPMRRLLHGDVGSGKTLVATYCLLLAIDQGGQAALMAPTEVLADQHYVELLQRVAPLGVEVRLLKGSQTGSEKKVVLEAAASGRPLILVGTHALIQEGVKFADLRVVVIDEQHRFGVRQRDTVLAPGPDGVWPHALHMSATPIPRTLSLTLYGDLDVSVLDEMPPGRTPVTTRRVFADAEERMWAFIRQQLDSGRQAYVVCPLIEESDSLDVASARQTYEDLRRGHLANYGLRLLHGAMKPSEKSEAMAAFSSGEAQVLVSTTVIEVGVDVPNASVMVIMGARRFGLSQLHQLRGRVGRGGGEAYCFLMADTEEEAALERLAVFARTNDGFALAEADLATRGEGQLFGERQSGLGDLRVASLLKDRGLLERARKIAWSLIDADRVPQPQYNLLLEAAEQRFAARLDWVDRA